ncbi:alpha-S1-casein isoform X6 [Phascolarctos cinereus]|uniref:Alpha-S1-casein-like isoform X7 n=1 Tax=Phascolarctos cinereus TaxID=38626 RepID=A0A6P5KGP8_PHACI|nr:alpha-S1-casein-like isoform X7 [Phascolarctos cinereus]
MKLLFFSCLVALALAMPDALHLSADNENVIPLSEVSSSEESFHQLNRDRYPLEEYELDKSREDLKTSSSEESVTPSTEERVRREVGYTFIKEGSSASREQRKKDVNGRRLQDLRKLLQERAIHLRYLESLYHPIELIKPQEYRELFMPKFYYPYVPVSMPRLPPYSEEASVPPIRSAPRSSIKRATEADFTHSEEKKN